MTEMPSRPSTSWCASLLALLALSSCFHGEGEWRAKLRELEACQQQLDAERELDLKTKRELAQASEKIEQLQDKLDDAGINVAALGEDVEAKARALEERRQRAAQRAATRLRFEHLRGALEGLAKLGVTVTVRHDQAVIDLPGDVLFDTARETLKSGGESLLRQVAAVIRDDASLVGRDFLVVGHTDDVKYAGAFKDSTGLSLMRAREVLAFLVGPVDAGGGGLDPRRWGAAGRGDRDPLAPNDSAENRQRNRRCELVLLSLPDEMLDIRHSLD